MKKSKMLATALLGAALAAGSTVHAQSILVMVEAGHTGEDRTRAFGDWVQSETPGSSVSFSADYSVNLLDSSTSLSTEQMDLANSFDLIIFPRHGTGSSGNYGTTDWNNVSAPIMIMNPFTGRSGNWAWHIDDSNYDTEVFTLTATSEDITMFTSSQSVLTPNLDANEYTGNVIATTQDNLGAIIMWDGTESAFYNGGSEGPNGRRTAFISNVNGPGPQFDGEGYTADSAWTPEGQQLFLDTMEATIPEPGTYALLIGAGALGTVLVLRRRRQA